MATRKVTETKRLPNGVTKTTTYAKSGKKIVVYTDKNGKVIKD